MSLPNSTSSEQPSDEAKETSKSSSSESKTTKTTATRKSASPRKSAAPTETAAATKTTAATKTPAASKTAAAAKSTAASKTAATAKKAPATKTAAAPKKAVAPKRTSARKKISVSVARKEHDAIWSEISETARIPRIAVTEISPVIEDGLWSAKAVVGETFPVRATVFREGHDHYAADVVLVDPRGKEIERSPMYEIATGLDRYEAWVCPTTVGEWSFHIESWSDPYSTWSHNASIKIGAGSDVELSLEEGAALMERTAKGYALTDSKQPRPPKSVQTVLLDTAKVLRNTDLGAQTRLSAGLHAKIRSIMREYPLRDLHGTSRSYPLQVDRKQALYGSWYEIFPRSHGAFQNSDGSWVSGTLRTATKSLPRIARMGFDVIYLTPIHPIGETLRKGPNNSLTSSDTDPGSPYGIGSELGGHDAIHPDLGSFKDFDAFVKSAKGLGMEVALDLALQCSPDHPWVKEHPSWFTTRADGTIAHAENPPKKYQDIYPLNFDNDPEGIYQAIFDVLETWITHGVTFFRVDNPHTKPLVFWQRLLHEMHQKYPEVLFLSEAFTRPAMMRTLGAIGFHQSYTYFTWRTTKEEITEYLTELAEDTAHLLRPTFWPATHDILTPQMWDGAPAVFALRAVLAATGAPSWGIYSGYELVENVPRPGSEESIDNEKYEYRPRSFDSEIALRMSKLLSSLNSSRRNHPALQHLRNVTIHETSSPSLLCYSRHYPAKYTATGEDDTVIVVINLDPNNTVTGEVYLDLSKLGTAISNSSSNTRVRVHDEINGHDEYIWGAVNYVELDPAIRVAHVFSVEPV